MSGSSYWDTGPGDPGRPVIKFTKIKPPTMQVLPIPCTLCKKPFYQFVHLQQHSRCHSGRRPFKCHSCDRSFLQLSHLLKHRIVKHEVKKKCQSCGSMYSRWSTFLHHTIQAHGARTLTLPKLKQTAKKIEVMEVEKPLKPIKLCIKKSILNMTEQDTASERRKAKKRKKHKKHKKEMKKLKQNEQNSSSDIKVQCANSKRIILKFKMSKDVTENRGEPSQVVNKDTDSSKEQKTNSGAGTTERKTETFTDLVQSPSPKDSGIDDCSPLHETDHNENCSSNSACVKSGDNKHSKDITTPVTSATSSSTLPPSLSTTPTSSSSVPSPRRPTRQDAALRSLMSVRDTPNSSAPSTPDNRKTAEPCKPRSSPRIKQEVYNSPCNVAATPSPHTSLDADYTVPPSPSAPPLKLTISKKPAGKLRGTKYTSSLHVSPEFMPPVSPCESLASKSPRSVSESPRTHKRPHSPGKAYPPGLDQTEIARLIYSPDTSMTRSPRPAKSPRVGRVENTIYTPRHQPSLSPAHSLKPERDLGLLNVDIGDDPYAFDDDPCNNSPHLLPYTSTLPKRSDKYKLDPPVLEPQIMSAHSALNDGKHKTRPKLTKQVDLKKHRARKSPARLPPKDVKPSRTPRPGKRGKHEDKLLPFIIKQEIIEPAVNVDESMPTLTHNLEMAAGDSVTNIVPSENTTAEPTNQKDLDHLACVTSDSNHIQAECTTASTIETAAQNPTCSKDTSSKDSSLPGLQKGHSETTEASAVVDKAKDVVDKSHVPETSEKRKEEAAVETAPCPAQSLEKGNSVEVPKPDEKTNETAVQQDTTDHKVHSELTSLPPDVVGDVLSEVVKERSVDKRSKVVVNPEPTLSDIKTGIPEASADSASSLLPGDDVGEPIDDVINDSDLLLSDPQLENLSFNESFLELGNDTVAPGGTSEALFDDLHDSESTLQTLETASKASSMESKRKVESDPIVVTVPGEPGMAPISLVIDNDDSDHFGESDNDDFDLASSLSSAPLAVTSLASSHSSSASVMNSTPLKKQPLSATAAVVDTDSEFAALKSNCSVDRVASKPPVTGFFNAFASFVGAKQPLDMGTSAPGYCSEFAKFLSQKSTMSDDSVFDDYETPSRAQVEALKHEHLRVEKLCEQVQKLVRTVFPFVELPVHMSGSSCCGIETLIEQIIGIGNDQDSWRPLSDPSLSLCAKPDQCLAHLRTKVCDLLGTLLPDISLPPSFNRTGDEVDQLVEHVIDANVT